jgi:hypothetical protein
MFLLPENDEEKYHIFSLLLVKADHSREESRSGAAKDGFERFCRQD